MKMKKVLSLVLAMTLIVSTWISVNAAETTIQVTIDGEVVVFTDAQPFIDSNNRTLVPLRAIGEAMGLVVEWDAELKTAAFMRVYDPSLETAPYDADEDGNVDAYLLSEVLAFEINNSQAFFGAHWMGIEEEVAEEVAEEAAEEAATEEVAEEAATEEEAAEEEAEEVAEEEAGAEHYAVVEYAIAMDTEAVILNARTYAPVRYLAEAFNYDVSWNQETQTVELTTMKNPEEANMYVVTTFEEAVQSWLIVGDDETTATSVEILSGKVNGVELEKTLISEEEFENIEAELEANGLLAKMLTGFEADNNLLDLPSYRLSLKIKAMIDDAYEIFEWEYYGVEQK
ncbi:stalk domain-containing protein [Petrocella sp. FN5]|uniref:stalk domain-containing protein n=1 Tax=Petrocella sp. FN5 TaxID=3032002 RepID=UPI0023DB3E48|nr:stalk domain-containing protein [Petrocella sp. FN5]MDF1617456.1 stalk domain-containing protein [Petrocella sp. FN5]